MEQGEALLCHLEGEVSGAGL
jgi:hypothetical protein